MLEVIIFICCIVIILCIGIILGHFLKPVKKAVSSIDDGDLKYYLQAMELVARNDFDTAIRLLEVLCKGSPDKLYLLLTLGNLYRSRGQFEKAIKIHQGILAKPQLERVLRSQTYFSLGLDYKSAGFIDRGILAFNKVLKIDRHNTVCLEYLRELFEDSHDWESAFETEIKLLKLTNSKDYKVAAYLKSRIGREYLDDGRFSDAMKCFKQAIKFDKTCFLPYIYMGDAYIQKEKDEEAEKVFKKALEQNPKLSFLLHDKFEKIYSEGTEKPSEKLIRLHYEILEKAPDDIPTLMHLAEYYTSYKMNKDAEYVYEKILDKNKNYFPALKRLTELYFNTDQLEKAYTSHMVILKSDILDEKSYICSNCRYKSSWFFWRCPHCKSWDSFVKGLEEGA